MAGLLVVLLAGALFAGCASHGSPRPMLKEAPTPSNRWVADNDDRDSDGDGLTDFQEIHKYLTDPFRADSDGDGIADGDWQAQREFTYSIRNVMEIVKPVDLAAMTTDSQDARLLEDRGRSVVVEVTHYPFSTAHRAIGDNRDWRQEYRSMTEYLTPTRTANWDPDLRAGLLRALESVGIEPDRLTDRQVVERVSAWLFRTFDDGAPFTGYFVEFTHPIRLRPELRSRLVLDNPGIDLADLQGALELGVIGKRMFAARKFGACTSSAILLTTVLRALGIPTRIALAVPAIDANDPSQWAAMREAISHPIVRTAMEDGLARAVGWASHTYNEVFVGGRWVPLNYTRLGQPSLDARNLGLLVQVNAMVDWSDADLTSTWGLRFAGPDNRGLRPALSSRHPYRSLEMSEHFGLWHWPGPRSAPHQTAALDAASERLALAAAPGSRQ
ncbi:MAG: transglutaminase domain-containing protein [Candidatus Rokuibacteriota bacterium]